MVKFTNRFFVVSTTWLLATASAFSQGTGQSEWQTGAAPAGQSGQSEWQTPGGGSSSGQSEWQTPGGSASGQSGWQQPAQQAPAQSGWQQPQQSIPQQAQSGWQQPQQPMQQQPMQQQAQSGWQQPAASTQAIQPVDSRATPKLQASASATKTLGDALQQEQHAPSANNAQPFNPDIDPNAAAMMMNQLQGGVSANSTAGGAAGNGGAGGNAGAPMDPGAALMGALAGGGGGDALNSLSQSLAPALMMMMEVMPGPGQAAPGGGLPTFGQTSQMGYAPRPTVRRAAPSNPLGNIIPSGMVRSLMYQGVSRAMYH